MLNGASIYLRIIFFFHPCRSSICILNCWRRGQKGSPKGFWNAISSIHSFTRRLVNRFFLFFCFLYCIYRMSFKMLCIYINPVLGLMVLYCISSKSITNHGFIYRLINGLCLAMMDGSWYQQVFYWTSSFNNMPSYNILWTNIYVIVNSLFDKLTDPQWLLDSGPLPWISQYMCLVFLCWIDKLSDPHSDLLDSGLLPWISHNTCIWSS